MSEPVPEPALGFRAWAAPGPSLSLTPFSVAFRDWTPGPNRAVCHARPGQPPAHDAPASGCGCGLYAFHDPSGLTRAARACAGVVAAWGAVEVHATGFRAEWAQVLALASDLPEGPARSRVEATALRYGVPVVAFTHLEAYGREFARTLTDADGRPDGTPPALRPDALRCHDRLARRHPIASDRLYLPRSHTWVRIEGDLATVGIAAPLALALGFNPSIQVWPVGEVSEGAPLATITGRDGGVVALPAPVSGELLAVNRATNEIAPHAVLSQPYTRGWLARVRLSSPPSSLVAAGAYRDQLDRWLASPTPFRAAFGAVARPPRPTTPDLLPAFRRPRPPDPLPRAFASPDDLVREIGARLRSLLPRAAPALAQVGAVVELRHSAPDASLLVALGVSGRVAVLPGPAPADATISMSGDTADLLWRGELDVARALTDREIVVDGAKGYLALSLLPRAFA
ncbi:MAG TPA: hypothetical protein VNT32_15045 [Thermoleophilaceae bacterium]|nr:hypothetical protein [Thermoleophilaceae bacterium]